MKQEETKWYFEDYISLAFSFAGMMLIIVALLLQSSDKSLSILYAIAGILASILASVFNFTEKILREINK